MTDLDTDQRGASPAPEEQGCESERTKGVPAMSVPAKIGTGPVRVAQDPSLSGLGKSGFARNARLRAAGSVAATPLLNHAHDDEPHEEVGFGD